VFGAKILIENSQAAITRQLEKNKMLAKGSLKGQLIRTPEV